MQVSQQGTALGQQVQCPRRLHGHDGLDTGEIALADAECLEVLLRQVDAARPVVLGDVLAVLEQLQRGAHQVREPVRLCRAHAEDPQHDPADRVGRQHAVVLQIRLGGVPGDLLVLQVRPHQPVERLRFQPAGADRGHQPPQHRLVGLTVPGTREVRAESPQPGGPVTAGLVPQAVDDARDVVERAQIMAQRTRQYPDGDREVLGTFLFEQHTISDRVVTCRCRSHRLIIQPRPVRILRPRNKFRLAPVITSGQY